MCAAVARTEQKYSIPRNSLIPEPSVLDILASGTMLKTRDGKADGVAIPLFRATADAGSQFSMQNRGMLYYFKRGQLYVYDAAKTVPGQLFDGVSLTASFVLPGVGEMAGALSEVVQKGGEMLLETVGEKNPRRGISFAGDSRRSGQDAGDSRGRGAVGRESCRCGIPDRTWWFPVRGNSSRDLYLRRCATSVDAISDRCANEGEQRGAKRSRRTRQSKLLSRKECGLSWTIS